MLPLRVEHRSFGIPIVSVLLIAANISVYVYQVSLGAGETDFIWKFAVVPKTLFSFIPVNSASSLPPPITLLTSMFLHGGLWHILGNMLFLWVFGGSIEDKLGYPRFIIFYLICGAASGLIQAVASPASEIPIIGASGAIAGVMGAFFLRFPRTRILTLVIVFFFIRVVRVPALFYLGFWLIFQIVVGAPTAGSVEGGVAYFAHIGGFLSGMVMFKILEKYK